MTLQHRIDLLVRLGEYLQRSGHEWQHIKEQANRKNPWFAPEFIEMATNNIVNSFLQKDKLERWVKEYNVPAENNAPLVVGIVMAGNIPLVGFHDLLCIFITGHISKIKLSSKDEVLLQHIVSSLKEWESETADLISIADNLKGCDAYIATGSNNSGRYFDYYFGKYPHIIRRNRTSVAVLDGTETSEELEKLADDIQTFFGLGCRNVTKLFVPLGYDFSALLKALNKYEHYENFHKYKHNYDYQLALLMMGNKFYMTNGTILLSKNESLFTAVSQVNYEFYNDKKELASLKENKDVQCIVGHNSIPFGQAQQPSLFDYPDGVDTMKFAVSL
ncbi:acyl-CoA reductase [Segetibacter aerophilus]|uniref:Acyl-CoA reductase n=1 Tax=Segetibacter aerophilus TaxID=670293 RepID=A0A512BC22_9BACT|nr:acyl-CoA reductase [Segetibacter aerophilus]GEO09521.1 acyl-CoA reductase [Segetibacter aerophilus]